MRSASRTSSFRALGCLASATLSVSIVACASENENDPPTYGPVIEAGASDGGATDARGTTDGTTNDGSSPGDDASDDASTASDASADARPNDGSTTDARTDSATDANTPPPDAGCPGSVIAVVGGTTTSAYASFWANGAVTPAFSIGTSSANTPAIVATSTGFLTVFRTSGSNLLRSAEGTTSTFAQLADIPGVLGGSTPSLTLVGSDPNLVYRGTDSKMYRGVFASGSWDGANDPVGGSGASQSFGPSAPTTAALGTELLFAQSGDNGHVYAQSRTTAWQTSVQVSTEIADKAISPTLVTLDGGTRDALLVWVNQQGHTLKYATRSGNTWSTPASVYDVSSNLAFSNFSVVVSPLSSGRAVLAYRGTDDNLYFTLFDGGTTPTWSAPARVMTAANMTSTIPSIARGTCNADAVLGFVDGSAGGLIKLTRLQGTTWTTPEVVSQTNGSSFVAIATK